MADDFFKENTNDDSQKEEGSEVEKIKLGETEFTSEELEELVGKAKKINDFEEKQGQNWEEVAKSWGKRGERIGEYKKKLEEYEKQTAKPATQEQLTEEQTKAQIIAEAQKYGLVTRDELNQYYQNQRAGERLLSETRKVIRNAQRDGSPKVSEEKLLEFMASPDNPKNPEKAYKLMFEKELDEIKEKKLKEIKKSPMVTETKTTTGKEFKPVKVTKDNLRQLINEHFAQGRG